MKKFYNVSAREAYKIITAREPAHIWDATERGELTIRPKHIVIYDTHSDMYGDSRVARLVSDTGIIYQVRGRVAERLAGLMDIFSEECDGYTFSRATSKNGFEYLLVEPFFKE